MAKLYDIDVFLAGYKPGLLYNPNYTDIQIYTSEQLIKLNQYPKTPVQIYEMDQLLYFRNNDLKQQYIVRTRDLESDSPTYHKEIGIALGFPPSAAAFFSEHYQDPDWVHKKIGVHYCGIEFSTSPDHFDQDIIWLWDHVSIPDSEPFRQITEISFSLIDEKESMRLTIRSGHHRQLVFAKQIIKKALDFPVLDG